MENSLGYRMYELDSRLPKALPDKLFHYTTIEAAKNILKEELTFWFTHIDDFEDLYEGKTIEVYYDLALHHLYANGMLTSIQYEKLKEVKPLEKTAIFFDRENEILLGMGVENCDVYVLSLSSKGGDPYMFENYVKNENKTGCCIELVSIKTGLNDLMCQTYGVHLEMAPVLYGSEIIEHLIWYIQELCGLGEFDEIFERFIKPLLRKRLRKLQYTVKMHKFCNENETRMILSVPPKDKIPPTHVQRFIEFEKAGKRRMKVCLPSYCCCRVMASPGMQEKEKALLCNELKKRGYDVI